MPNDGHDLMEQATGADVRASRRSFLKNTALSALAAGALTACKGSAAAAAGTVTTQKGPAASADSDASGGSMAAHPKAVSVAAAAEEMDRMHEAGIKAFPAKTAGKGNQLLAPRIENGVKIFELTAKKMRWETMPGQTVEAWAYNEQIPGPQIREIGRASC